METVGLRSSAAHERKKGNVELAGVIECAADEITALAADRDYWIRQCQRFEGDNVALSRLRNEAEAKERALAADNARLRGDLDRYRYAVHWISADSWDWCPDCRSRLEWARSSDPDGQLSDNRAAEISKQFNPRAALEGRAAK